MAPSILDSLESSGQRASPKRWEQHESRHNYCSRARRKRSSPDSTSRRRYWNTFVISCVWKRDHGALRSGLVWSSNVSRAQPCCQRSRRRQNSSAYHEERNFRGRSYNKSGKSLFMDSFLTPEPAKSVLPKPACSHHCHGRDANRKSHRGIGRFNRDVGDRPPRARGQENGSGQLRSCQLMLIVPVSSS